MTLKKRKPQRSCIVCREAQDKRDLIRIVRTPEGKIRIDPTGKVNGRGAYLCHQPSCWQKGVQKKLLANALKTTPSAEDLAILQEYLDTKLAEV